MPSSCLQTSAHHLSAPFPLRPGSFRTEEETAKVEPEKTKEKNIGKVEVRLQAAGDAPIMKQKNYNVRFFNALCL